MEVTITQFFSAPLDRFWKMWLFDEQFLRARYDNMRCTILERKLVEQSDRVVREVRFMPDRKLPGALKALIQGATEVRETSTYFPADDRCEVSVLLPIIGPRTTFVGSYSCTPRQQGFERTWRGTIFVDIPFVGGRLERYFSQELQDALAEDHRFCSNWLRDHLPSAQESS